MKNSVCWHYHSVKTIDLKLKNTSPTPREIKEPVMRPKKAENESKISNVSDRRLSLFKNAHFHLVFKMKTTSIKNILYLNFYS